MLLKGPRLIIPGELQEEYLSRLHEGHLSASKVQENAKQHMSHFAYACKTEGKNGISRLISELLRTLDSSLRDRLFVLQNEVF